MHKYLINNTLRALTFCLLVAGLIGGCDTSDKDKLPTPVGPGDFMAVNDTVYLPYSTQTQIIPVNVLANDKFTGKVKVLLSSPVKGQIQTYANSTNFNYASALDFFGVDSMSYQLTLLNGDSNLTSTAKVYYIYKDTTYCTIVARNDAYTISEGGIGGNVFNVGNNDDFCGQAVFSVEKEPAKGKLYNVDQKGRFNYQPDTAKTGTDSFTYKILKAGQFYYATVTITIEPNATCFTRFTTQDDFFVEKWKQSITLDVLGNDDACDKDHDLSKFSLVRGFKHGTTAIAYNLIDYRPQTTFRGLDTAVYEIGSVRYPTLTKQAKVIVNVN